jgi:hypothetical protein
MKLMMYNYRQIKMNLKNNSRKSTNKGRANSINKKTNKNNNNSNNKGVQYTATKINFDTLTSLILKIIISIILDFISALYL